MKRIVTLGLALVCHFAVAQSEETAKIEVLYGGYFSKSEDKFQELPFLKEMNQDPFDSDIKEPY